MPPDLSFALIASLFVRVQYNQTAGQVAVTGPNPNDELARLIAVRMIVISSQMIVCDHIQFTIILA